MAQLQKIDSNATGLRWALEQSYGTLPGSGVVWYPLEPNSYADFGGQITTIARNPINQSRQRQKGVVTDLDSSGGFNMDLTQTNLQDLLQGFFFANTRRKNETSAHSVLITDINGGTEQITLDSRVAVSAVVANGGTGYVTGDTVTTNGGTFTTAATWTVTAAAGVVTSVALLNEGRYSATPANDATTTKITGAGDDALTLTITYGNEMTFQVGDLILLAGNDDAANNGLKRVTVAANNVLTVAENLVTDASPAAGATLVTVGFQTAAGDLDVVATGGDLPHLTSTALDFTTLGLIPGEWMWVGGDSALTNFLTAANDGWVRIKSVAANLIVLDKTSSTWVTEANVLQTVQLFFGRVIKNENDPTLIVRKTYQLERTLGAPDDTSANVQGEYLTGAVPGQITLTFNTADKVTCDLSFIGKDFEQVTAGNLKAGTRPAIVASDAFNTSSDFSRLRMVILDPVNSYPTALFAYLTEFSISINNSLSPNKAISVLGNFEVTAGQFLVDGTATAYFSNVSATQAVRNNSDVSIDFALVKGSTGSKSGIVVDLPLIALGDGRPNVEQDAPITLPLTMPAAADRNFNHTLLMGFYDYLPNAADV